MQSRTFLPKRVIKKISLSAATIAVGIILWANVAKEENVSGPCLPGFPDFPGCLDGKDGDIASKEFQAINDN